MNGVMLFEIRSPWNVLKILQRRKTIVTDRWKEDDALLNNFEQSCEWKPYLATNSGSEKSVMKLKNDL